MSVFTTTNILYDLSNMSAFGTIETNELTPIIQVDFVYGINSQIGSVTVANSGIADTNASRLRLQSGTNSAGSAIYQSRRPAHYRAGQGITARFTSVFATGTASNTQIIGLGNTTDGYFFGYNGATFSIDRRSGGSDNWVAQTSWNGDKCNGTGVSGFTINPQLGNIYMIKYPFLGYGNIQFFIQNPATSRWILCHTIQYANSSASTEITVPNLFFYVQTLNSGNTTNLTMFCGSAGIFLSGTRSFIGNPKWGTDNNKGGITAETNILSLRNCTTYNGVTNTNLVRLQFIGFGGDAGKNVVAIGTLRFRINATVGGTPSFTPINGNTADNGVTLTSANSIVSVDTAGTTATAGTLIWNDTLSEPGNDGQDLTNFGLIIAPGEILTISGFSGSSSTIAAAINWAEDI